MVVLEVVVVEVAGGGVGVVGVQVVVVVVVLLRLLGLKWSRPVYLVYTPLQNTAFRVLAECRAMERWDQRLSGSALLRTKGPIAVQTAPQPPPRYPISSSPR